MNMASCYVISFLLFVSLYAADGFLYYGLNICLFNSTDRKDIEYVYSEHINRVEYIRFSSSVNYYVGYTELGMKEAARRNNNTETLGRRRQKVKCCQRKSGLFYENILDKWVQPHIRLQAVTPPAGRHPNMLVCSVFDFYPRQITVSWLRDGHSVTSEVTSTDELADADWYYQIHSHLEYTPRPGETISCVVEHASLKRPLVTDWDPSMPDSERNKIAIGASGLVLGLTLFLAGILYYKKKKGGRILVPTETTWT